MKYELVCSVFNQRSWDCSLVFFLSCVRSFENMKYTFVLLNQLINFEISRYSLYFYFYQIMTDCNRVQLTVPDDE